jgi:hypothetical protein
MTPIRAKLLGIHSALYILYKVETAFPTVTGKAFFHNDCIGALQDILSNSRPDLRLAVKDNYNIIMKYIYCEASYKSS